VTDTEQDEIIFDVDDAIKDLEMILEFLKTNNSTDPIGDRFTVKELEYKIKFQRAALRTITTNLYLL